MSVEFQEFRVSNDAIEDPVELRRRIDAEGYLFFRSLQEADRLRDLRHDILRVCREGGWLREGTDLMAGVAEPSSRCTEGDLEYAQVYHQIYKLESFHRAGHWPETSSFVAIRSSRKLSRRSRPFLSARTSAVRTNRTELLFGGAC